MLIKRKSIEAQANHKDGPGRKPVFMLPAKANRKIKYAPVTLSELDGVRFLHFGTEWVQGAMRLRKPDWIELEYAQQMMAWMLFIDRPNQLVQLGLGTGALTKSCYRQFPEAQVTAIELNPAVITICRSMFKLPNDDARLRVLEMDAQEFVDDPNQHGKIDVLQIDLYDATAKGPVLESVEFYQSCAACLTPDGMVTVNLFGDHPSYKRNLKALEFVFDMVICLPEVHDGNVVAIGFKRRPMIDFSELYALAIGITESTRLPAKSWVNGIQQWMQP